MEKFKQVKGVAVPLKQSNVDTDQIIPAVYLKRITKTGFEDALFAAWRQNKDFILNKEIYANPKILVAGSDFGTGSSREHAVWALRDYGFKVVISSRFADIFRGNSAKQGLLTAVVSEEDLVKIFDLLFEYEGIEVEVDLEKNSIIIAESIFNFFVDEYTKWRLLNGFDDIAITMQEENKITEFEKKRSAWLPQTKTGE